MFWNGVCPFWNAGSWGAWTWIGLALTVLFWIALIAGVIYLIRWMLIRAGNNGRGIVPADRPDTALRIAQRRYARGEIGREEYLNLAADLQQPAEGVSR